MFKKLQYAFVTSFVFFLTACSQEEGFETQIQKQLFFVDTDENQKELHHASTLLVSCVDFRLRNETSMLMEKVFKLNNNFDETAFPGAALAFITEKYPNWNSSIEEMIKLLTKLHGIKRVIFLDHYECGGYKLILGAEKVATKQLEREAHKKVFSEVRKKMSKLFPDIKVYTLIIDLDGTIEKISE